MRLTSLSTSGATASAWLVAILAPILVAGAVSGNGHDPRLKADPDSTGSLPKSLPTGIPPALISTTGVVIDAKTGQVVSGLLVVVTNSHGEFVAAGYTDVSGTFQLYLEDKPDLELALPAAGMAGIELHAGAALVILVP